MGLDLTVEGCAKLGHEEEWRRLIEGSFDGDEPTEADVARFRQISTPPYQRLDAPRVGFDPAADAWILEMQGTATPEERQATLEKFHGYYALRLVKCDGIPEYTHAGLYEGVDETSFRGAFLSACTDVLSRAMIDDAWNHKMPDAAVEYGRALLASAEAAIRPSTPTKGGFLARLGLGKSKASTEPFEEQLHIVRAAGRWFIFWGERGHPIRAWF